MNARACLPLVLALLAAACEKAPGRDDAGDSFDPDAGISHVVPQSAAHLPDCLSACGNEVNPPTGGPHCATTLACRKYSAAQPRCQWIHNLEHGHAVLAYNCPNGCADLVQQLEAIWDAAPAARRILLTPDPLLPRRVAAVVWGWSYSGDEVDPAAIATVLSHQDEEAPEAFLGCAQ